MKLLLFSGKYIILGGISTILAWLTIWNIESSHWSIIFLLLYLLFFSFNLGQFFLPKEERFWKIIFGFLGIIALFAIILSGIYWFYEINMEIVTVVLTLIPILIGLQHRHEKDIFADIDTHMNLKGYIYTKSYLATKLLALIILLGDGLLFLILYTRQFTDTLISPWTIIGPRFFILFTFVTLILLWVLQKSKHPRTNLLLLMIHSTLILTVALIIFKLGFGFDPFIHQATENWILQHGFILPKHPYYIGQYMLVIAGHSLTHLPIHWLDKILVPLAAGIFIPLISYFTLARTKDDIKLSPALALIPLLPLSFFTVTTPNNLALLFSLIIFFWIWYENKHGNQQTRFFGILLSLAACTIHPFIGLPLLSIYLGSILFKLKLKYYIYIFYGLIISAILPLTFYLNSLRLEEKLSLKNPFTHLGDFLLIFTRPHWIWLDKGTVLWQTLYIYRDLIKPLVIITIILGIVLAIRKYKEQQTYFYLASALGLGLSAFWLATTINFSDVISYEQRAFSYRLMEMLLVLLLPFFIIALRELFLIIRKHPGKQLLASLLFSLLLLTSWYFTYPTRDPVSFHTGWNVRAADIITVRFISQHNQNKKDYIVLTNQLVSATALREFGFDGYLKTVRGEQYFYSIPTGGPLYQYFRKMVYEEPKREWMEQAMHFANVKKAYFVHTNYWAPAAEIRDKAKLEADE